MGKTKTQSLMNFIGFDSLFEDFGQLRPMQLAEWTTATTFPHYNVSKVVDGVATVEIAVAGYAKDEISVTVDGDQLTVTGDKGSQTEEQKDRYVTRGIANRTFKRTFRLASGLEVDSAELVNGMLTITLSLPEKAQTAKTIEVK